MVKVAIDGRGRVLRVFEGEYKLLPHSVVELDTYGNEELMARLSTEIEAMTWDGAVFHHADGTVYQVNTTGNERRNSFQNRDVISLLAQAKAAQNVPAVRAVIVELAKAIEELQALLEV